MKLTVKGERKILKAKSKSKFNRLRGQNIHDEDGFSLNQKVDFIVYLIAIGLLIYFVNRDYGNIATKWFTRTFPNEAAVLLPS